MASLTQKPTLIQSLASTFTEDVVDTQKTHDTAAKINKGTILLLDDDTFLLDMYSKRLEGAGYETIACSTAEDALEILRSGRDVNLMLIDIIMPVMSGFEFMQAMKDEGLDKNTIKVVLSNTSDQTEAIERGQTFGVSKYMVKAESTPSDVVGLVDRMLS